MTYNPNEDGITHINIYSGSLSRLGRFLSHFTKTPFEHPTMGKFESMEGLWYFVKSDFKYASLRTLWGKEAKQLGKTLPVVLCDDFWFWIEEGNRAKLAAYPGAQRALKESTLPFTHYYVFGQSTTVNNQRVWAENAVTREAKGGDRLIAFWEKQRALLKDG